MQVKFLQEDGLLSKALNMTEQWQVDVEFHRIYQGARSNRNSYFEKLAVLDDGTVALIITAVLGPLHGTTKHRYTLLIGLTALVVAMFTLLRRNYLAVQLEFHATANTLRDPAWMHSLTGKTEMARLDKAIHYTELAGLFLSASGIVVLLLEVWLFI